MLKLLLLAYASVIVILSGTTPRHLLRPLQRIAGAVLPLESSGRSGLADSPAALALLPWLLYAVHRWLSGHRNEVALERVSESSLTASGHAALRLAAHETSEKKVRVSFPSGASFQAIITAPDIAKQPIGAEQQLAFVCTHPWAIMGGNMHNNVPAMLSHYVASCGHTAIRFNFRGWGVSRGHSEVEDVCRAAEFLLSGEYSESPGRFCGAVIVGYSYGSLIAAAAAQRIPEAVASVIVSPPWTVACFLTLFNHRALLRQAASAPCPKLVIHGTWDSFTSPEELQATLEQYFQHSGEERRRGGEAGEAGEGGTMGVPAETAGAATATAACRSVLVEGGDHFWAGAEVCLFGAIHTFLQDTVLPTLKTPASS